MTTKCQTTGKEEFECGQLKTTDRHEFRCCRNFKAGVSGAACMVPRVFSGEGVLEWPQKTGRLSMKRNRSFGSG